MEDLAEKIQDYIEGKLVGEELQEFEEHLLQHADVKNQVDLQKEVHKIINRRLNSGEDDLRDSLVHAENELRMNDKGIYERFKPFLAVASVACIFMFGYLFFFANSNTLYELPTMQSEIVRGQESNSVYEEAVKLYNEKSYATSREFLNTLIQKEPDIVQYQYYVSLTYVGEEDWEMARSKLSVIANGTSIFKEEAKYYLAVSLEKLDDKKAAIAVLKTISSNSKLGKKAAKLLNKLD